MDMLNICPVCLNNHSDVAQVVAANDGFRVDCPVCGCFALSEELWEDSLDPQTGAGHNLSELCRARLSHRLRTGSTCDSSAPLKLRRDFLDHFIEAGCTGPIPAQQATNIIRYIGDEVSRAGEPVSAFPVGFYAIVGAPNAEFAARLALELLENRILSGADASSGGQTELLNVNLSLDGWERYEKEKRGQIAGKYGFIAMKFGDDVLDPFVENTVKPAVKEGTGYDLVDMRDVARAGIIDNIMRTQIRDAAFVIVDLTHDNSGAYWEAGYAEGLGKPVIFICEKSKFDDAKTHFDTNHCTTVLWSQEEEDGFQQQLVATLRRSLNLFPGAS